MAIYTFSQFLQFIWFHFCKPVYCKIVNCKIRSQTVERLFLFILNHIEKAFSIFKYGQNSACYNDFCIVVVVSQRGKKKFDSFVSKLLIFKNGAQVIENNPDFASSIKFVCEFIHITFSGLSLFIFKICNFREIHVGSEFFKDVPKLCTLVLVEVKPERFGNIYGPEVYKGS